MNNWHNWQTDITVQLQYTVRAMRMLKGSNLAVVRVE